MARSTHTRRVCRYSLGRRLGQSFRPSRSRFATVAAALVAVTGCGDIGLFAPAPLFTVPLAVEGRDVGDAVIDTGGAYEVLLRDDFGLAIVDEVEVLVFGGTESVGLTEAFAYTVGGVRSTADGAIVGISTCDCNGLGVEFFRKSDIVLGIGFSEWGAAFLSSVPGGGGATFGFAAPPARFADFDSVFLDVDVEVQGVSRRMTGLLDTGAAMTVMRAELAGELGLIWQNSVPAQVTNEHLGTANIRVGLFETADLPDMILGTDIMQAWGDRWYFQFSQVGGTVTVFEEPGSLIPDTPVSVAAY